ncbi:tRNA (guanosine(46)-N7)-methyltransferase TrmB [Paramagnetospirillum magneticum]|uniref:tRNA (guanine-N(7)-)-methyltransferase n=1 Tax=Paramagnetospirillum magneticum (strain ATCC 700264 / AMB-1) TaxID=342108 RepID=TRMB_PARM1|nr:tRNA (guanosine(46)-N7)-methyltransferase TrmB [Paramagnetospirillum magneticum]Q2VYQ1.1 RecName: Full=tRNA (guanine-N(7)-)-methyltransferase; AltName: Full=tRNA (guanine(46)-N(7))-methyltransferase; AltName: Full=tRNA(m7G46)-methyltransferase [Paramagnetospirillum magneticum AMB-1]BAE53274.1 tRNA (guanine-N(7)-)-methyltransferase [Paramagnetospirillum magneticum AMB-1]
MGKHAENGNAAAERPRFFGRRQGKALRRNALGLIEDLLPRLTVAVPEPDERVEPALLFPGAVRSVWLEVGFGGGEHLAQLAEDNPDIGLIGCEVFRNGIASLLGHVQARQLGNNVRVFPEDVRLLLPALPDGSLGRVFVLFPDPWPKTRHADRRFISPETLDVLARVLESGGELRVASDDPIYVAWAARHLDAHPAFEKILATADRSAVPADWPATRYEQKCITGRAPVFFLYRRRAR